MKIIGPIAGIGSRLRPFTLSKPKAFINISGRTVLDHILEKFINTFDSETELILIVGYKKRQIIEYVRKNYKDKFKLTFIEQKPQGFTDNVPFFRGLGEAVYITNERFKSVTIENAKDNKREGCLIFLGDMIPLDEYSYLMYRYYESDVDGIITVMRVPEEDASSYGIVETDDNNIIKKLVEKPQKFISNLAIAGIYAFSHSTTMKLFDILSLKLNNTKQNGSEVYLTESLQDLVNEGFKIAAVELKKGILDFGKPSGLLKGSKFLLENNFSKQDNFHKNNIEVDRSWINNPTYIGKNSRILNSVIGPYVSIGKGSHIEKCIIENSVIEKNAKLKNIITEKSIIGSNVNIENISKDRLIIGDKSVY
ncbi:MAG: hypothetical protein GF317_19635 [Candidatus Lokiarchaeota archaeon]|nr:hypothetical protein [Candidatus Lokiarchaeota archaeon]MBD3201709.1 hypothetical protein [Candidatus Lokiarchaeota archaeon]